MYTVKLANKYTGKYKNFPVCQLTAEYIYRVIINPTKTPHAEELYNRLVILAIDHGILDLIIRVECGGKPPVIMSLDMLGIALNIDT